MSWIGRLLGRAKDTRYSDEDFELILPGAWHTDHEATHLGFVQGEENQQVTAATSRAKRTLDMPQEALRRLSGEDIVFSEVITEERDGGIDVTFAALDETHQVQVRVLVCARPNRLVTLSFNKYAPLVSADEFSRRASQVRAGLRVR
jgi:hypothetical protein